MPDLTTTVAGVELPNPMILASGILGVSNASLKRVAGSGAGAVAIKSIGAESSAGHDNPVVTRIEDGLINAVGLPTKGVDESIKDVADLVKSLDIPVIASFYGKTLDDFPMVAEKISEANPAILEANISCPNVEDDMGLPFACDADLAAEVVARVKKATDIPLIVKLSPNVADIRVIAKSVEKAGADAICAVNTLKAMKINIDAKKPVLANKIGGLSGPALKPVAVRCVWEIFETVKIPIVGVGGVSNASDAIEFILAGASAVGVGTAVVEEDLDIFKSLSKGISTYMQKNNFENLGGLVGVAH